MKNVNKICLYTYPSSGYVTAIILPMISLRPDIFLFSSDLSKLPVNNPLVVFGCWQENSEDYINNNFSPVIFVPLDCMSSLQMLKIIYSNSQRKLSDYAGFLKSDDLTSAFALILNQLNPKGIVYNSFYMKNLMIKATDQQFSIYSPHPYDPRLSSYLPKFNNLDSCENISIATTGSKKYLIPGVVDLIAKFSNKNGLDYYHQDFPGLKHENKLNSSIPKAPYIIVSIRREREIEVMGKKISFKHIDIATKPCIKYSNALFCDSSFITSFENSSFELSSDCDPMFKISASSSELLEKLNELINLTEDQWRSSILLRKACLSKVTPFHFTELIINYVSFCSADLNK